MCYPEGRSGKSYYANDDCLSYHNILSSADFKALLILAPELKRFQDNPIESKTVYMLKEKAENGEDKEITVEDALKANNIEVCTVHTHEKLAELQKAVAEALEKAARTEETEPEPEPSEDETPDEPAPPQEP